MHGHRHEVRIRLRVDAQLLKIPGRARYRFQRADWTLAVCAAA